MHGIMLPVTLFSVFIHTCTKQKAIHKNYAHFPKPPLPLSVMALCCDLLLSLFRIALSINKCKHKTKQTRTKHPGKTKQPTFGHNKFLKILFCSGSRSIFTLFLRLIRRLLVLRLLLPLPQIGVAFSRAENHSFPRAHFDWPENGRLFFVTHFSFLLLHQLLTFFVRKNSAPKILVTQKKKGNY